MSGWIKIHRSIKDHWLYVEKRTFSKFEAWHDILIMVNFSDGKTIIEGKLYEIKRGQSILSQISWGLRWNWDRSKVRRFLELLQKENMIVIKTDQKTTYLTVCKYETYQSERTPKEHQTNIKRTSNEHQTNIIEEEEERKEEKETINFDVFLDWFNKTLNRNFKSIPKSVQNSYKARLKEGYKKEDIMNAIVNCSKDKYHIENPKYLTPEFMSRADKLAMYFQKSITTTKANNFFDPRNPKNLPVE